MLVFLLLQVHDEIIERRPVNSDRQHINETIRRLAKPKNLAMTQSSHASAQTAKTMPVSRSSHQLRMPTSSTTTNRRVISRKKRKKKLCELFLFV